jgi:hypothetical protein
VPPPLTEVPVVARKGTNKRIGEGYLQGRRRELHWFQVSGQFLDVSILHALILRFSFIGTL